MSRNLGEVFRVVKVYVVKDDLEHMFSYPPKTPVGEYREKKFFICHAIRYAAYWSEISNEERDTAISLIEKRLGQTKQGLTHTVHTFLEEKGYLTNVSKLSSEGFVFVRRQLQMYRHRWLDSLIKEFS